MDPAGPKIAGLALNVTFRHFVVAFSRPLCTVLASSRAHYTYRAMAQPLA